MRIENNTLIFGDKPFPFDAISSISDICKHHVGGAEFSFNIDKTLEKIFNLAPKPFGGGYRMTVYHEDENTVRECWNAINEYKSKQEI